MPLPEMEVPSTPPPSGEKKVPLSFWGKLMKDDLSQPILQRAAKGGIKAFALVGGVLGLLRRQKFSSYELQMAGSASCFVASYRLFASLLSDPSIRKSFAEKIGNTIGMDVDKLELLLKKFRPGIIGWLAAFLSLSLTKFSYARNTVFVTYCITRAIWFSTSSNPLQLPPSMEKLYPVIWMCISAMFILSHWLTDVKLLDPKYAVFLNRQGGHNMSYMPFNKYKVPFRQGSIMLHPNQGAFEHLVKFFISNMGLAVKLYLPIHLFILFISRNRSLGKFAFGLLRSTVFLALYCTLAWSSFAFANFVAPDSIVNTWNVYKVCWVSGLAVLVEDQRRQSLLSAYCVTYAIDSIYRLFLEKTGLRHTRRLGTLLILSSVAVLFQKYDRWVPHAIQKWLLHTDILEDGKEGEEKGKGKEGH